VERTNERGEVEAVHLLKSREELVELFAQRGVPIADKSGEQTHDEVAVAAMCGSGVTACPLALVLYTFGRPDVPIYDGSWYPRRSATRTTRHAPLMSFGRCTV
jgi:3-mercaptopyruvate sulfurtransferase SseA